MNMKRSKGFTNMMLAILILLGSTVWAWANSAQPPSILIIVPNAPADMAVSLKAGDAVSEGRRIDKVLETYFTFYQYDLREAPRYTLVVQDGEGRYEIPVEGPLDTYNNIFTLNAHTKRLAEGKLPLRDMSLVALRLVLTLALEGAVFWIMGFRSRRTWIAFLIINLITQGALNLWISDMLPLQSYALFVLIFGEFFVFAAEGIAFGLTIKEHRTGRVVGTVMLANILSLFAGGVLITWLPL